MIEDNPSFFDDAYFADPSAVLAAAAARTPVIRTLSMEGEEVFVVTRPDHVVRLLDDPALTLDKRHAAPGFRGFDLPAALDSHLLNFDGPEHARLRRLVAPTFSARRVQALRPAVQAIADRLLDDIADGAATHETATDGTVDVVAAYATPLPIAVICELLGIPDDGRADFKGWIDAVIAPDPARPDAARQAVLATYLYMRTLIDAKRAALGDDLLSALIAARDDDDVLSEDELTSTAFLVLGAGYETTVNLIAATVLTLLTRPELRATVQQNPDMLPGVIEEALRLSGPVALATRRFAVHDLAVDGVTVPAHSTVLLGLAAVHQDAGRYPHPEHVDPGRPVRHLGFGYGAHFCLGAPLARMEARIAVESLLARHPGLALAVPAHEVRRRPSTVIHGITGLPVTLS